VSTPGFLAIGHVTKDLLAEGYALGGGVTFAVLTALRLGQRPALLTRAEPAVAEQLRAALAGVAIVCLPSPLTTTFRNTYGANGRLQHLLAVAEPLGPADLPPEWRTASVVLLAPVAGEVPGEMVDCFPDSLLGLAAQGWLRRRAPDGLVLPAPWQGGEAALARADLVVFSEEDVAENETLVARYADQTRLLALTQGARGVTLYQQGRQVTVPAFPAVEVDPTGAGDVFGAAFLIAFQSEREPLAAARFANCAASFAVEQRGTSGIPSRAQVIARLRLAADTSRREAN
jgi:1D-myo-inositol 3-kinase